LQFNSGEDSADDEEYKERSEVQQVEEKTENKSKGKDLDWQDTKSSPSSTEDKVAKNPTGNISGSPNKYCEGNDKGTGDHINGSGDKDMENGTSEENTSANKENVNTDTDKSNANPETIKVGMKKDVPNCGNNSSPLENESKTLQGNSVEEGLSKAATQDNLTTEEDPER
jgi:hypothetical protein